MELIFFVFGVKKLRRASSGAQRLHAFVICCGWQPGGVWVPRYNNNNVHGLRKLSFPTNTDAHAHFRWLSVGAFLCTSVCGFGAQPWQRSAQFNIVQLLLGLGYDVEIGELWADVCTPALLGFWWLAGSGTDA